MNKHNHNNTGPAPAKSPWKKLGAGLVTGAADDDPSAIATYSQVGAAFGYGMLWSAFFTYPLMVGIQLISARVGRVTGKGLAANIRTHLSARLLYVLVSLLLLANIINIAADLGAMGAALKLLLGGPTLLYTLGFGVTSLLLQVFVPFPRYSPLLKLLTLTLFTYVATVFVLHVHWAAVLHGTLFPQLSFDKNYLVALVAVFGTTISPYLFFWQASQEVEEQRATPGDEPLKRAPEQARAHLQRIEFDTYVGMGISNLVAFFIMLTAAVSLNAHGVTNVETSAQAAQALRPLAGEFAFALFAAGIIGTGMLALPILAGSAAYAVAETFRWRTGLGQVPHRAREFYMILSLAILLGVALNFTPLDPIKALFWSAVINGVIAVPFMVTVMLLAIKSEVMGRFVIRRRLQALGWLATAVMALAVLTMVWTLRWN
ncbi:MAG: NRAMP family divalent metal transporter [Gammaproteobacteria bacterium]